MKEFINSWSTVLMLCLLLGLAPFYPEPHLWGKIKWIAGGANGMAALDWFDFFWHAWPYALLLRLIFIRFVRPAIQK
jgi:hypothetical protein